MKILPATIFDKYIEKGGSTKPWVVFLLDEEVEIPYVVKLFTDRQTEQQHPVLKEVLGCVLAKMFSLYSPDYALATFSNDFINHSLTSEQREILLHKHQKYSFASKLTDSVVIFTPSIHKGYLKDYDFANLYAFDTLIFNLDRGRAIEKPNILIQNNDFLLIDHELTFPFIDNTPDYYNKICESIKAGRLEYPFQRHLAYFYLRSLRQKEKVNLFDEFEENLRNINIDEVRSTIYTLALLNISCGYYNRIIEYLYILRNNSSLFCKTIQNSIL